MVQFVFKSTCFLRKQILQILKLYYIFVLYLIVFLNFVMVFFRTIVGQKNLAKIFFNVRVFIYLHQKLFIIKKHLALVLKIVHVLFCVF